MKHAIKTLLLFDHDGTICDTNPLAYDSIKFAYNSTIDAVKVVTPNSIDWNKVFSDTTGTTGKNLIRYLAYTQNIPLNLIPDFENKYYHFRAKWFETMRSRGEYIWDSYFPDAHQLAYECKKSKTIAQWLLTGNPEIVVQERITNSLRDIFLGKNHKLLGVFGDEAYTRKELLDISIGKAQASFGKNIIKRNRLGFTENIIYIADSKNDFFAGLEAKIRTVWIPSRKLQDVIDVKNEDYVKYILSTVGDNIIITNDLSSKNTLSFINR